MAKLTIYTLPECIWCARTKAFLKQKKIPYTEKDVASDERARNDMLRKSKQTGVPVLDIGGKIIVGFDPEGILNALARTTVKAVKKQAAKRKKKRKQKKTAKRSKKKSRKRR